MAAKRDYYDILGLDRSASEAEIKRAFRRLAFKYHPDHNNEDGAEERFKEINEAYEVLSDPERRANYDRFGHMGQAFGRGFEDFDIFRGFGDIFDSFFGGATTATRRGPQQGTDLRYSLPLSFEEAVFGCEKEIELLTLPRDVQCPWKPAIKVSPVQWIGAGAPRAAEHLWPLCQCDHLLALSRRGQDYH